MTALLDTGVKRVRNVGGFIIGAGSSMELTGLLAERQAEGASLAFVDKYFESHCRDRIAPLLSDVDIVIYVDSTDEPTTEYIDALVTDVAARSEQIGTIIGIGGGTTMDVAKAVANLLTNGGSAADYQGWDLVRQKGVYKIAVPTLSGTGAEATRTCVMTNKKTGLKLGMNSDYTVYDNVIMDPDLLASVPREQYFFTGMDAYIHCMEAMAGSFRNAIGDALSQQSIALCEDVFLQGDMMRPEARESLMVASYLGGCAIATSYVGVVHPLSAGLSVVLGLHHCIANCIVMRAMKPFYPQGYHLFWKMAENQSVVIPEGVCSDCSDAQFDALYQASIVHEKPLTNALGENFRDILTPEYVKSLFKAM